MFGVMIGAIYQRLEYRAVRDVELVCAVSDDCEMGEKTNKKSQNFSHRESRSSKAARRRTTTDTGSVASERGRQTSGTESLRRKKVQIASQSPVCATRSAVNSTHAHADGTAHRTAFTLHEAIERMECQAGVRRADLPPVVFLVNVRIQHRMVKPSMNPVDAHVGEEEKRRYRKQRVRPAVLVDVRVELRVAAHLEQPNRLRHDGHEEQRPHCALYLERHLFATKHKP